MKKILTIIGLAAATLTGANAVPLINEPFNVAGTMGTAPYASWTSVSGIGTNLTVSVANGLTMGPSDRDYVHTFAAETGWVYAGFDLTVTSLPNTGSEYISVLSDGAGFDGRMFLTSANTGSNFSLGLSIASNTIGASTAATYAVNTTYRIVYGYNPTSDNISLWTGSFVLGSPTITTTGTDASTQIDGFVFRQAGAFDNGAASMNVQNLVVSATFADAVPEPSTWALIGVGFAFAIWRFRRRTA